jgi:hypothetical protein
MAIDAKTILKRLEEKQNDRGKATLYLSKSLFKDFKSKCGDHSASVVIEELMKEFIASTKSKPRRNK